MMTKLVTNGRQGLDICRRKFVLPTATQGNVFIALYRFCIGMAVSGTAIASIWQNTRIRWRGFMEKAWIVRVFTDIRWSLVQTFAACAPVFADHFFRDEARTNGHSEKHRRLT